MKQRTTFALRLASLCLLLAAGCKKQDGGAATQPAADTSAADKTVNLFIFSDYIPQDVLDDFKKETGIEAHVATLQDNEDLPPKLRESNVDYDLVSPSDYMVRQLAATGSIRKLDRAKLTNFANLDPAVLGKPFDPANDYSVPLFWGTVGIGYNKKKVTDPVDSWAIMFNPKYKGQILMLDDGPEMLMAALRLMGKDPNTTDIPTIDAAVAKLKEQHDLVKVYTVDGYDEKLSKGDVSLAMGFNGQFAKVIKNNPDLAYSIPKEGGTFWIDNLCIPTKARRAENAILLMNFLMRPDIAVRTANFAEYATPNKTARPKVNKDLLESEVIYPPADVMKRCLLMTDRGQATQRVSKVKDEIKG